LREIGVMPAAYHGIGRDADARRFAQVAFNHAEVVLHALEAHYAALATDDARIEFLDNLIEESQTSADSRADTVTGIGEIGESEPGIVLASIEHGQSIVKPLLLASIALDFGGGIDC
jgi:hypothetical protein